MLMAYGSKEIGERINRLWRAMDYESASAFARALDVSPARLLNVEGGLPLSIDMAQTIVRVVPGTSLDWLYNGVETGLTVGLRQKLASVGPKSKQRRRPSGGQQSQSGPPWPPQGPKGRPL